VMYAFVSGDSGYPEANMIYTLLHLLTGWMKNCDHPSNVTSLFTIEYLYVLICLLHCRK
jgi:hypothetical protein